MQGGTRFPPCLLGLPVIQPPTEPNPTRGPSERPTCPTRAPSDRLARSTQTPHRRPLLRASPGSPRPPNRPHRADRSRRSLDPSQCAFPQCRGRHRKHPRPRRAAHLRRSDRPHGSDRPLQFQPRPPLTHQCRVRPLPLAIPVPEQHQARAPTDSPAIRRPADKFRASPRSIGPHAPRPSRTGFHTPRTAPESYRDPGDTRPDAREPTSIADLSRPTPCVRPPPGLNPTPASRPHPRPDEPRPELSGEGAIERAVMFQAAWQAPGCHDRCHAGSCSRPSSAETPLLSAPSAAIAPCADRQARA